MRLLIAAMLVCPLLGCQGPALAQDPPPPGFDPARHMRVSEVKVGMKGYGLSVFKGTTIERFDVEVLSILHNFNPRHDVVLVRCAGANLEHTGAIAGMSGSPIFLHDDQGKDRMIGAFAYGWPLMKDPVGGVQPIEYMLAIPQAGIGPATRPATSPSASASPADGVARASPRQSWSIDQAILLPGMKQAPAGYPLARWGSLQPNPRLSIGDDDSARLRPLATPLMAAGIPPRLIEQFGPLFRAYGLVPLQGGATAADAANAAVRFEPGAVLAVPLLTGDFELTAIGTCTEVIGPNPGRVLGFGHAFNNEGEISLPMGTGMVHSVIANLNTSFKLGSLLNVAGTLTNDQMTGVVGRAGAAPTMIPLELHIIYADGSIDQTYRFQAAQHPRLTPLIAAFALNSALTGPRELPQFHTLDYDLKLQFATGQSVRIQNRDVNVEPGSLFGEIIAPISVAAENPFEQVPLTGITGTLRVTPQARMSQILSISVPRLKYQPGETVRAFVTHRPFRGDESILPVDLELPQDLPDGTYQLTVADWQTHLAEEQRVAPFRFTADDIAGVFDLMRDILGIRHDALYLRLLRNADGVAVGRVTMPHLPSSHRDLLMGAGLSNVTALVSSLTKIVPTDYVMEGSAEFALVVDRNVKTDVAGPTRTRVPGHDAHPPVGPKVDEPKAKPEPAAP